MKLSIVLPCYHPPEGWVQRVIAMHEEISRHLQTAVQFIIVDDGNGTSLAEDGIEALKNSIPGATIINYDHNRGKGYALRKGVEAAAGDTIIYTDIDFPYSKASLLAIFELLNNGTCDVAVGIKNDAYYRQVPRIRRVISKNLRLLIKLFLKMPITDTQCGLKGFTKKVKPIFLETVIDRYLFDLEFLHKIFNQHPEIKIKAVPVQLNEGVVFRKMSYKILFPEMMNFLKLVLKRK